MIFDETVTAIHRENNCLESFLDADTAGRAVNVTGSLKAAWEQLQSLCLSCSTYREPLDGAA